jgi:hypothetical protein
MMRTCSEFDPLRRVDEADPFPPFWMMAVPRTSWSKSSSVDFFDLSKSSRVMTVMELAISLAGVSILVALTTISWRRMGGAVWPSFSWQRMGMAGKKEARIKSNNFLNMLHASEIPPLFSFSAKKNDPLFLPKKG